MNINLIGQEKAHLAELIEAVQRCVYFLEAADTALPWPLDAAMLEQHKKDAAVFGALAALNERFAKLQDTLGAAMRHAMGLYGEPAETFLDVLAFQEKTGVIETSAEWQICRTARNLAAHSYETNYALIAEHFNTLHEMRGFLYRTAGRFIERCQEKLGVGPARSDFVEEFESIIRRIT